MTKREFMEKVLEYGFMSGEYFRSEDPEEKEKIFNLICDLYRELENSLDKVK